MAPLLIEDDSTSHHIPCHHDSYANSVSSSSSSNSTAAAPRRPLHDAIAAVTTLRSCRSRLASSPSSPRSVSFGALVASYEVIGRDDITDEEKKASWFDRDEIMQMKENVRSEAKLVDKGVLVESKGFSVRGLESKTRTGARSRRNNRMNARAAVFFEIECQEQDYYYDEEGVAEAYLVYSGPCQSAAEEIGMRDEMEARDDAILRDDDDRGSGGTFVENSKNGKDWADYFFRHPLNRATCVPVAADEGTPSMVVSSAA